MSEATFDAYLDYEETDRLIGFIIEFLEEDDVVESDYYRDFYIYAELNVITLFPCSQEGTKEILITRSDAHVLLNHIMFAFDEFSEEDIKPGFRTEISMVLGTFYVKCINDEESKKEDI